MIERGIYFNWICSPFQKKLAIVARLVEMWARNMKQSPVKIILIILFVIGVLGALQAIWFSRGAADGRLLVEKTRGDLRRQGFKVDLSEFDFHTSADVRQREAALTAAAPGMNPDAFRDYPNLMNPAGSNFAIVVWKQPWPRTEDGRILWPVMREAMNENRMALDEAGAAAASGPIRFELDARGGSGMLLRHLAPLRSLEQSFDSRIMLELHDGHFDDAWTNLFAATRLVTAWEPEPAEVSHNIRFMFARMAYAATWQALQAGGWSDEQLSRLQTEWASVNFFTNLAETAAFKRASTAAMCEQILSEPADLSGFSAPDFVKELMRAPRSALSEATAMWADAKYRKYGIFVDEQNLLLHFQHREVEIRNAIPATNWLQMRALPGVTSPTPFVSKFRSRIQSMLNVREMGTSMGRGGITLIARAAESESRRRILVTALALERYRLRHGAYPQTLSSLAPEFLPSVPVDFMDGQPLRYRLTDDGHFILYSVGLDATDNGGEMPPHEISSRRSPMGSPRMSASDTDIVWPRPASTEEVEAVLQQEKYEREQQWTEAEEDQTTELWNQSDLRLAGVTNFLTQTFEIITNEPLISGRKLGDILQNFNATGTNRLRLDELLTLKQVFTGEEPETITFELPISFDALPDARALTLWLDAIEPGTEAAQQECKRATNGNCLLIWHAIFDPPGLHALQACYATDTFAGVSIPTYSSRRSAMPYSMADSIPGPPLAYVNSNLCQFSLSSATYDEERGAIFHCRLPEANGSYIIECTTTNGVHLKTLTGSTSNGMFKIIWDLVDDQGHRLGGETFSEVIKVSLPDSGRSQNVRGP